MFLRCITGLLLINQVAWCMPPLPGGGGMPGGGGAASSGGANLAQQSGQHATIGGGSMPGLPGAGGSSGGTKKTTTTKQSSGPAAGGSGPNMANLGSGSKSQQQQQTQQQQSGSKLNQQMGASNQIGGLNLPMHGPVGGSISSKCPACKAIPNADYVCKNAIMDKTKYTCKPGYEGNGQPDTIKCEMSGKWKPDHQNFKFACRRSMCTNPPTVPNAGIDGASSCGTGESITYKCKTGYRSTSQNMKLRCDPSKNWDKVTFACKQINCGTAPTLANGKKSTSQTIYQTAVTYSCNTGYKIANQQQIICGGDGKWAPSLGNMKCNKVECPKPTTANLPALVNMVQGSDWPSWKSTMTYTCKTGYVSNNQPNVLTCQASGKWHPTLDKVYKTFKCIKPGCKSPPTVANGKHGGSKNEYKHGETVQYSCNTGYTGSGSSTCNSGTWSTPSIKCTIVSCGSIRASISSSQVTKGTNFPNYQSTATFTCNQGYKSSTGSNAVLTCQASGQWNPSPASLMRSFRCIKKECPATVPTVANAKTTSVKMRTPGSRYSYTCNQYYEVKGNPVISCQNDETWQTPSCTCTLQKCGTAPVMSNASPSVTTVVSHGGSVTYTCKSGYRMLKAATNVDTINCVGNQWNKKPSFTCESTSCDASQIPAIANADRTPSTTSGKLAHGTKVEYNCRNGYYSSSADDSIVCHNAKWSKPSITCIAITCEGVPEIQNAHADNPTGKSVFNIGDILKYFCNNGKISNGGKNTISCKVSAGSNNKGAWSKTSFKCLNPKSCGTQPTLANANPSVTGNTHRHGAVVSYTCKNCFKASSSSGNTAKCNNGQWTGPSMSCGQITCASDPVPSGTCSSNHIVRASWTDQNNCNSVATYKCANGYSESRTNSKKTVTCQSNGKWTDISLTCSPATCSAPPTAKDTVNTAGSRTTFKHGDQVTYTCKKGMTGGKAVATCVKGSWAPSSVNVPCKAATCKAPPSVKDTSNDAGTKTSFNQGAKVTYKCNTGLTGSPAASTCTNGQWSKVSITCKGALISSLTLFTDPWDCKDFGSKNHKNKAKFVLTGDKGSSCTVEMDNILHNYKQTLYMQRTTFCKKSIGKMKSVTISHVKGNGFRYNMIYICDSANNCYTFRCGYRKNQYSSCVVNNNKYTWGKLGRQKKTAWGASGHTLTPTTADKNTMHVVYTWTSLQYGAETGAVYLIRFIDVNGKKTQFYDMNVKGVPLMGWNCPCQNYYLRYTYYYQTREPRCAIPYRRYSWWNRIYFKNSFKCTKIPVQAFYYNLPQGFKLASIELTVDTKKQKSRVYNDGWYFHGLNVMNLKNERWNYACGIDSNHRFCALDWDRSYNFAMRSVTLHNIPTAKLNSQVVAKVATYTGGTSSAPCQNKIKITITDDKGNTCVVNAFNGQTSSVRTLHKARTQDFHIICSKTMGKVTKVKVENMKDKSNYDSWQFYKICITPNIRFTAEYCFSCGTYYNPCKVLNSPGISFPQPTYTQYYKIRTTTHSRSSFSKCNSQIQVVITDTAGLSCTTTLNLDRYGKTAWLKGTQYWNVKCVTKGRKMGKVRYAKFSNKKTVSSSPWGRWFMLYVSFYPKNTGSTYRYRFSGFTKSFYSRWVYYYIYYSTFTIYVY